MNLILASASPRRAELLQRMGLSFTVQPSNQEEILEPRLTPEQEVISLSRQKAEAIWAHAPAGSVVLSADTVVVLDGQILGKPRDEEDAKRMLRALSGRGHLVMTGVTVISADGVSTHCETTGVHFRELSQREIDAYVATGEPMDKAGAYGIQGYAALFVTGIQGDYYNVMGLPVCRSGQMLRKAGISVLEEI